MKSNDGLSLILYFERKKTYYTGQKTFSPSSHPSRSFGWEAGQYRARKLERKSWLWGDITEYNPSM